MKEKLLLYGFELWQVDKLLSKKKLSTGHGLYTLKGEVLKLQQGNDIKAIEL